MPVFGTLGNKWNSWSDAGCQTCRSCPDCGVLHSANEADLIVWGECIQCPRGNNGQLSQSRINLHGAELTENLVRRPMMCPSPQGHRPVGISKIWVHMHKAGVIQYELKIDCFNPSCEHDPSVTSLVSVGDTPETTVEVSAEPCCSKPQLQLVSMKCKHLAFDEHIQLPVSKINFSQNTINTNFRAGGLIVDAIAEVLSGPLNMDSFPPISVVCRENKWFSLDNRRLQVFKQVCKVKGTSNLTVLVVITKMEPGFDRKFTSQNDGANVGWANATR